MDLLTDNVLRKAFWLLCASRPQALEFRCFRFKRCGVEGLGLGFLAFRA